MTIASQSRIISVVLLIPALGAGGAERVIVGLANDLVSRGAKVTLLTLESPGTPSFYSLAKTVDRVWLDALGGAGKLDRVKRILGRLGAIRRVITAIKPNIVVSFMDTMNITAIWALIGTGIPVIVSERVDPRAHRHRLGATKSLLRQLSYPLARTVVVQTTGIRDYFGGLFRRRLVIIPNAITPANVQAKPAEPTDGRFRLIGVGRLDQQKGFDLAISAFAALAPDFPDWDLVIWGEGVERSRLEAQISAAGLYGRVHLPGLTQEVAQELSRAHLMLFPSRYEGFPNALGEAMACGLPAVAFSGVSGVADLIEPECTGLLVMSSPPSALVDALTRLMGDASLRMSMGERAAQRTALWAPSRIHDMWWTLLAQPRRADPQIN